MARAAQLQAQDARVVFLQVIEPISVVVGLEGAHMMIYQQELKLRAEQAESYLGGLRGEFREKGIEARSHVASGPVVEAIIDAAGLRAILASAVTISPRTDGVSCGQGRYHIAIHATEDQLTMVSVLVAPEIAVILQCQLSLTQFSPPCIVRIEPALPQPQSIPPLIFLHLHICSGLQHRQQKTRNRGLGPQSQLPTEARFGQALA